MTTWCYIKDRKNDFESIGGGALIKLPDGLVPKILEGEELGALFLNLPNQFNYKKEEGPMGYLTNGVFSRLQAVETSLIMTFGPLINNKIFEYDGW